jgi:hypothetical protein
MSNPLRPSKTDAVAASTVPSAFFDDSNVDYQEWVRKKRNIEYCQARLAKLDMEPVATIVIPKNLSVDPAVLNKKGPAYALAKVGAPAFRVRSGPAFEVLGGVYDMLPSAGFASKERVKSAIESKFYVDGGTEATLGRLEKAFPKKGNSALWPITKAEAKAALDNCGVDLSTLPSHAIRPAPLQAVEGERAITVNPKADNGFPLGGKWETPGAATMSLRLAVGVREELRAAYGSGNDPDWAHKYLRKIEREKPYMAALRGKAKADYYKAEKIQKAMLRFYNAFPRHMVLNMQVCTQTLEAVAKNILVHGHSGIGISLHHGGADDLVQALDAQLARDGFAYVHVGDDSWLLVKEGDTIVMCALDCSNFDLTQHHQVTRAVHDALRTQLERIDALAAGLWHAYARERVVVVVGALAYRWKHAGPSGMPLQSKVNDMLMDVLINRVKAAWKDGQDEASTDRMIQDVGRGMGFDVRVEQYTRVRARSVREAIEIQPFLFIGYYFSLRVGQVVVTADVPRTLSQLPYPGLKWMATRQDMQVMEAMRLGSMLLSAGVPAAGLDYMFDEWERRVRMLLEDTIERYGDKTDERLRWAVGEAIFGPATVPSLKGLLKAVTGNRRDMWLLKEVELPSSSRLVPISWADEAEQEDINLGGWVPPASASLPAPLRVAGETPPTHPVTAANHGRPPPTARWGPNKAPARHGRERRVGRVLHDDEEESVISRGWDDEDDDDFYDELSYSEDVSDESGDYE